MGPVGRFGGLSLRMDRGDRGLNLIRPGRVFGKGEYQNGGRLLDLLVGPKAAILFFECE